MFNECRITDVPRLVALILCWGRGSCIEATVGFFSNSRRNERASMQLFSMWIRVVQMKKRSGLAQNFRSRSSKLMNW